METRHQEFRIGVMVLACIVSLVLMTMFFGRRPVINFGGEESAIQVRFQRAPGIKRNSPVFKNGVQIGRVTRVELVDQDQQVEVTVALDRNRRIYTDEECRIRQTVIMGDASLEFVKRLNYTGEVKEVDPRTILYLVGVDAGDLMSGIGNIEGDLTRAIQNVAGAAEQLGGFVERLNEVIGTPEEFSQQQAKFTAIVEETRQTMASMRQTTDGISQFINDPDVQHNVRKVISDLPDVIERSRVLVGESTLFVQETRGLIEKGNVSLDNLSAGLEKVYRTLESITNIADQIEGDVPEIVSAVKRSAMRLESLFSELTMIVENFRHADGTVKRLIRDPEAYEKLLATLDNVERITDEVDMMLRVDVKPIAHNVKILTDKAARDPAVFIRNLLRKEPPTKTLPYYFGGRIQTLPYYHPPMSIIDGDFVEVLDEVPIQPHRIAQSPSSLSSRRITPPNRTATSIPSERILPTVSEGRIVNVDPRYPEF
jgi:ABC-type transporter Mla subunit MlaD